MESLFFILIAFVLDLLRGYVEFEDQWITPFNGLQYKLSSEKVKWEGGSEACSKIGAKLAQFGVQDWNARRLISRDVCSFYLSYSQAYLEMLVKGFKAFFYYSYHKMSRNYFIFLTITMLKKFNLVS